MGDSANNLYIELVEVLLGAHDKTVRYGKSPL